MLESSLLKSRLGCIGAGRGTLTPDRFAVNRWPIIISDEAVT